MDTALLLVPATSRAESATTVADYQRAKEPLTESWDIAAIRGHELTSSIEALNELLATHRTAPRDVRLKLINLRHALTVRREADELENDAAARKNLRIVAERLAHKAQSGFSAFDHFNDLVDRIMQATA